MDAAGLAAAADVLEGVAEGAGSYWAHVTPTNVSECHLGPDEPHVGGAGEESPGLADAQASHGKCAHRTFRATWGG